MTWNLIFNRYKARWVFLWFLVLIGYLVIEVGANRSVMELYISYFTFDQQTGWYRLAIWKYGWESVANNPLFGIGFSDWARAYWMVSGSVDNFWLVVPLRHGIPALVLIAGSVAWIALTVGFDQEAAKRFDVYRVAYLICIVTYVLVGFTVHFWAAPYVWFLFLLGSGVWLADAKSVDSPASATPRHPAPDRGRPLVGQSSLAAGQPPRERTHAGHQVRRHEAVEGEPRKNR